MKCAECSGDGWYIGHESNCGGWYDGCCDCSGEQIQCEKCNGTGVSMTKPVTTNAKGEGNA